MAGFGGIEETIVWMEMERRNQLLRKLSLFFVFCFTCEIIEIIVNPKNRINKLSGLIRSKKSNFQKSSVKSIFF